MCIQVLFQKVDTVFSRVYEEAEGWDEISPGQEILLFSTDDADGADICRSHVFRPYGFDIQK